MNDLISRQALREAMYHEAFETDSDMQKWDSGCWIRYKMFENAIESAPTIDAVPVVRCKDCMWWIESHPRIGVPWCKLTHLDRGADGYCDMGERSEE